MLFGLALHWLLEVAKRRWTVFSEKLRRISRLYWLALLALLAGVSFYAAKHATFRVKAYAQITATPFVAETASYYFGNNPQGELFFKKVTARRSDGSTAAVSRKGPTWGASARSVIILSGTTFQAFDLIASKNNLENEDCGVGGTKGAAYRDLRP